VILWITSSYFPSTVTVDTSDALGTLHDGRFGELSGRVSVGMGFVIGALVLLLLVGLVLMVVRRA
jgi:hypothetical protein